MVLSYKNIIDSTSDVQYLHTFTDAKGCENFSIKFFPDSNFPLFPGVITCNYEICTESYFHTVEVINSVDTKSTEVNVDHQWLFLQLFPLKNLN